MRKYVIGAAIVIAIFISVMGFMAYTKIQAQGPAPEKAGEVLDSRKDARKLVHLCEDVVEPTLGALKTNAAALPDQFAKDRAKAKQTVADQLVPLIDTRKMACTEAKSKVDFVNSNMKVPDDEMSALAPKLDAQLAALDKIRANAVALGAALDAGAPVDELNRKLDALLANR